MVKRWLLKIHQYSHVKLPKELRQESENWRNYLQMDAVSYNQLIQLVTPSIIKQDKTFLMRQAISLHETHCHSQVPAPGRYSKEVEFFNPTRRSVPSRWITNWSEFRSVFHFHSVSLKRTFWSTGSVLWVQLNSSVTTYDKSLPVDLSPSRRNIDCS